MKEDFVIDNGSCQITKKAVNHNPKHMLPVVDWMSDIPQTGNESDLVEVQFKNTRKAYYHNASQLPLEKGDVVIVEANPGYDMGGYPDPRLKTFIKKNPSMIILIPFLPDLLSFQSALKTYNEIKELGNENIIFVISRTKKGDYDLFSNQMKEMGINKAVLELKESKLFQNMWNKKESIKKVKDNKLLNYSYKEVLNQLETLKKEVLK